MNQNDSANVVRETQFFSYLTICKAQPIRIEFNDEKWLAVLDVCTRINNIQFKAFLRNGVFSAEVRMTH